MKLSWILLSLLGYFVCFDHMASLNNPIVDAKTLQSFSDIEIEEKIKDIKFAVARTKEGDDRLYNGASMILSSHDPKVKLPQYSSARMHIQIGADDYIQAGWTTGEKECYNSMCSTGFVLVRSDLPLGLALTPSVRTEVHVNFYGLLKDKANGNWFFKFEGEEIGFWPANRFEQGPSNGIEWGGEVYSAFMPSPPMGNGYFPDKRYLYNAFITNITIVNEKFEIDDQVKYTEAFSDHTRGYKVIDSVHSLLSDKHMIQFGGPGNI